jgi:hypothetical protein
LFSSLYYNASHKSVFLQSLKGAPNMVIKGLSRETETVNYSLVAAIS